MTRTIFALLLSFLIATPAIAAAPAADKQVEAVKLFANDLGNRAIAIASNPKKTATDRVHDLEDLFAGSVDVAWVGKFVLGANWRTLTDAQKALYLKNYQAFVLKHYTAHFAEYTQETFKIRNTRDDGNNQYTLSMDIIRPGKENVVVDYRIRKSEDGKLKIFDIIVEGVSLITTQRSEFGSVVDRKGADYLIDQLGKKAAAAEQKVAAQK